MNLIDSKYPMYLRAQDIAHLFDISLSSAYALLHSKNGPPVLHVGKRLCVPRDGLNEWIKANTSR